MTLKMFFHIT